MDFKDKVSRLIDTPDLTYALEGLATQARREIQNSNTKNALVVLEAAERVIFELKCWLKNLEAG